MFLVTGATGKIGSEAIRLLSRAGHETRAFVRDESKATSLVQLPGVQIVRGDFGSPTSLDAAMRGVRRVLLVCMPSFAEAESLRDLTEKWSVLEGNAIDAARRAGVERIVRVSAIAAHPIHVVIDEKLAGSMIPFTILRPSVFMQNMVALAPKIRTHSSIFAPAWGPQGLIDVRDIASVAFVALTQDGHEGKAYDLTGPENLLYDDIAARFSEALGRRIEHVVVDAKRWCRAWGPGSEWYATLLSDRYASWIDRPPTLSDVVPRLLNRPARQLASWIRENIAEFEARPNDK